MTREQWTVYAYLCDGDNGNCNAMSNEDDNPELAKTIAEQDGWTIIGDGPDPWALCPNHRGEAQGEQTTAVTADRTPPPDDPRRTCRRCGNTPMPDSWVCAYHEGDDDPLPDGTMTSASYVRWERYWG